MSLKGIKIEGVRNLKKNELELTPTFNLLFGPNASGKTSLLEAIHLLGTGRSFRTTRVNEVVQSGANLLQIVGSVRQDGTEINVGIRRENNATQLRVGGKSANRTSLLAQVLPIQTLTPTSHVVLEQGPKFRRRFLDWGVFHVKPGFHQIWIDFHRNLKQRNSAIRVGATGAEIRQWDRGLSTTGERLTQARIDYLEEFQPIFSAYVQNLLGIKVDISQHNGWKSGYSLYESLQENRESDRKRGFTQSGPHRADLLFKVDGVPVNQRFSRGQQKLLVSALRLAQVHQLRTVRGFAGSLLVDDLAAELDNTHRMKLLTELQRTEAQIFVAVTEREILDLSCWEHIKVFHVEHGQIREVV